MPRRNSFVVPALIVVALLAVGFAGYYAYSGGLRNTYVSCTISAGGFEFRVVSDSTGAPITGDTIEAVDRLGCNGQFQTVYLDSFSSPVYCCHFNETDGGWLVPNFPAQATWGGELSFTITYQGKTYDLSTTGIPPVGTNCVTFKIPSGTMNSTTVMNGTGSYC